VDAWKAIALLVALFIVMLLVFVRLMVHSHARSKTVTVVAVVCLVGMAVAIVYAGTRLVEQDRMADGVSRVKQAGLYDWLQVSTPREAGVTRYEYDHSYFLVVTPPDSDPTPPPSDTPVSPDVRFFWTNKMGDPVVFVLPRSMIVFRPDESASRPMVRFQFKEIDPDINYTETLIMSGNLHYMVNVNPLTVDKVVVRATRRDIKNDLFVPDTPSTGI
jgi:hypothetical protein